MLMVLVGKVLGLWFPIFFAFIKWQNEMKVLYVIDGVPEKKPNDLIICSATISTTLYLSANLRTNGD